MNGSRDCQLLQLKLLLLLLLLYLLLQQLCRCVLESQRCQHLLPALLLTQLPTHLPLLLPPFYPRLTAFLHMPSCCCRCQPWR